MFKLFKHKQMGQIETADTTDQPGKETEKILVFEKHLCLQIPTETDNIQSI